MKIIIVGLGPNPSNPLFDRWLKCGVEVEYRQIGKEVDAPPSIWYDEVSCWNKPVTKPLKGPRDRWGKIK